MDLIYSQTVRFYEAPFQMKSNGGTLVIDDFGRNGLIPMIYSTAGSCPSKARSTILHSTPAKRSKCPSSRPIFATNLDPDDLVDDAFRDGYRLYVNPPDKDMYARIFQQYVESNGFGYDAEHLEFVYRLLCRQTAAARLRTARPDAALRRPLQVRESTEGPFQRNNSPGLEKLLWRGADAGIAEQGRAKLRRRKEVRRSGHSRKRRLNHEKQEPYES